MNFIWDKLTEWIRELLIEGIMNNLTGLFDQVNTQISGIADNVGKTPQQWNGSIFSMIQGLSDHVVVPIAGAILAVIATLELIQMIIDKNNFHDFDTFLIFKWVFKTAASVLIVTNTCNIVMGIFEAAQSVVNRASGLVMSGAQLSIESAITGIEARLADMGLGALFGLWFQTMLISSLCSRQTNFTVLAPNRLAVNATSIATLPPPQINTFSPIVFFKYVLTSVRKFKPNSVRFSPSRPSTGCAHAPVPI